MDVEVLKTAVDCARRGERVALATIVDTRGSVPRRPGSKMAVTETGRIVGTVGGGCGEADVVTALWETLRDGARREVRVDLTEPIECDGTITDSPAICGGTMRVYVELLD